MPADTYKNRRAERKEKKKEIQEHLNDSDDDHPRILSLFPTMCVYILRDRNIKPQQSIISRQERRR